MEISRTQARIEELQRLLDVRTNDLRAKHLALEDTERELARMQDLNSKLTAENANLTRDNDHTAAENYDLRKNVDFSNGRNGEMAVQIRDTEIRLKEREDAIFVTRKDVDAQRMMADQGKGENVDHLGELQALDKHSQVLQCQNKDLTMELDRFCQTDEVLRRQLDRRNRVTGLAHKNQDELRISYHRVEDARSRSPSRSPVKTR